MTSTETLLVHYGAVDDFDFLVGSWNVRMRRRREILRGNDAWYDLTATCSTRKIVGGRCNIDDFRWSTATGDVDAMTLRVFDPGARQWSIYWASSLSGPLEPPVVGGFTGAEGLFYSREIYAGRPIVVRFRWSKGVSPRWEQAFSADGGTTWEQNWTMEFDRIVSP